MPAAPDMIRATDVLADGSEPTAALGSVAKARSQARTPREVAAAGWRYCGK